MSVAQTIRISSLLGNSQRLDGGAMFGNVPRTLWSKWVDVDDRHRITLACRCMLVEFGTHKVLCETGIGNFFDPKLSERFGIIERGSILVEQLAKRGIGVEEIDMVILSHLHFDHAGGLLPSYDELQRGSSGLTFPKARYVVGGEALRRAQEPHFRDRASFIPELNKRLLQSGRLIEVDQQSHIDVYPDIFSFRYTHGHTPGQMHTVVKGSEGKIIFAGDLIPGTPWVHLPVTMGYDRFPEKLIDEKSELYQSAVPEKWWLFYTHDYKYSASLVVKNDKGRFEAVQCQESLNEFSLGNML